MYSTTYDSTESNKVLRNTFSLLALSMIPTVGGAWFGSLMGFGALLQLHPWLTLIGSLALMFALMGAIKINQDNGFGVLLMLCFSGFMGIFMSGAIDHVLAKAHGGQIIMEAAAGTGGILLGCALYAMTTKRDFSSLGGFLCGSLIALLVVMIMGIFIQSSILTMLISAVAIILFSFYLIYDVQQVVQGGETNYISATLSIYLDVMNIFINLLSLLSNSDD